MTACSDKLDALQSIWSRMEAQHPTCALLLAEVARSIYNGDSEEWSLPSSGAPEDLRPATDAGLISVSGTRIVPASEEVEYVILAEHTVREYLLPAWEGPAEFTEAIRQVASARCVPRGSTLAAHALVLLHNRHGKDVIQRLADGTEGGTRFPPLYTIFTDALPRLSVKVPALVPALANTQEAVKEDLAGGLLFSAVQDLCSNQRKVADELLDHLSAAPEAPVAAFLPNVLVGLAMHDFGSTHRRCIEFCETQSVALAKYAVVALGYLDYSSHPRLLRCTLDAYAKLMASRLHDTKDALATGYGHLLGQSDEGAPALCRLSELHDPDTDYGLARLLFRVAAEFGSHEWFGHVLTNLGAVEEEQEGTLKYVDMTLASLSESRPEQVFSFLEAWAIHSAGTKSLSSLFSHAFSQMSLSQHSILERWMTHWFSSDHHMLHEAAADLVAKLVDRREHGHDKAIHLGKAELDAMSLDDLAFTIHKILGYVLDAQALCSMIFSFLRRNSAEGALADCVKAVFEQFIAYNFPGTTKKFLEQQVGQGGELERHVATSALVGIEQYYTALRALPRLKELEPPAPRLREFAKAHSRGMARGMRQAEQHSPLLSLVTRMPIKGGRSWFSVEDGELCASSNLNEISFEMEIPRQLSIDPIGFEYHRMMWRAEVRGNRHETCSA